MNNLKLKKILVLTVVLTTLVLGTPPQSNASEVLSYDKIVNMIKTLTPRAKEGEAEAQMQLAAFMSLLLNPDYEEIAKWIEASASQGHVAAQRTLGSMYREGEFVSQDYESAIKWYTAAAEYGDAEAQFSLGWMHDFGEGVPQDYKIALKWFTLSAKQGYAPAQKYLKLERYQ